MAFMSQEHKKRIAAKLKEFMPAGWKYSLAVRNDTEIAMTISVAPVDLIAILHEGTLNRTQGITKEQLDQYYSLNPYNVAFYFKKHPDLAALLVKIVEALNLDNYNNSDPQRDYIDVGHYLSLHVGKWNRPFQYRPVEQVDSGKEACGACNGTGKVRDADMSFDSAESCMNCLGKGCIG